MATNLIYVIPDTQIRQGVRNPLIPVAHHIAHIKPNIIIHLGDHWDMPSLSKYDKGKKSHRVRTYSADINAGNAAMQIFWGILHSKWPQIHNDCETIILKGNHEHRIHRAKEYGPDELIDLMDINSCDYSHWDQVVPFLEVIQREGVEFCHYFQNPNSDRPISSARLLLMKGHKSRVAGHVQGFDYAEMAQGTTAMIQAMIAGSCYHHDEEYKAHTNNHFRGTVILKNVHKGQYDFSRYSLKDLTHYFGEQL